MNDDFGADLITLVDDDGKEHEFEILDEIDNDEGVFYALMPTSSDPEDAIAADTYYIFEVIEEDGEEQLAEVEDDELLDKLAAIFEERFESFYEDEDEEDDTKEEE